MPKAETNGITIEYDTFGDRTQPALLLIMGLGGQLIDWDKDICSRLADNGHHVIRFDNRDVGFSTKLDEAGVPDIARAFNDIAQGKKPDAPYTLDDMAADAAGLLDALNIEKAHVCGISMGGMIAQTMALNHPDKVLSLISIYSSTGSPHLPPPSPEAMQVLMQPPPRERKAYTDYLMNVFKTISGSGFPFDEDWHRELAAKRYERAIDAEGTARQFAAILASGSRKSALAAIRVPTLVIHGTDDPLVPVEGGKETAEVIPDAELWIIEAMGHDLPHGGPWPRIVEAICAHTKKGGK